MSGILPLTFFMQYEVFLHIFNCKRSIFNKFSVKSKYFNTIIVHFDIFSCKIKLPNVKNISIYGNILKLLKEFPLFT